MSIARKVRRSGGRVRPLPKMIYIPGGDFTMGSDHHYAEEKPAHRVKVGGFWIDNAPVTNAEFKHFDSEEKDGKCNPGFDGWRRNVDVVESCEGQSDAVGKGEGSDGLHQHPAVLHEQKQSEYEQQMVDTKQDVLNAVRYISLGDCQRPLRRRDLDPGSRRMNQSCRGRTVEHLHPRGHR